jgi:site-specific DNA-adenine methylase
MTTNYANKILYNVFQNPLQNTKKQIQEIKNLQNSKNQELAYKF